MQGVGGWGYSDSNPDPNKTPLKFLGPVGWARGDVVRKGVGGRRWAGGPGYPNIHTSNDPLIALIILDTHMWVKLFL